MFSAQFSKVLNDVWGNKTRTFLIVLSIAVGLLALGTVLNGGTLISEGTAQSYAAIHYANGLLVTGQSLDNNSIRAFANIEGIGEVDGRRELDVRAISAANTYTNIQVFSVPDYTNMRVNQITPTGGAWPPPRHQILIDGASLTVLGAQVGGKITIETASGDLRILPIVGTVQDLSLPPANFAGTVYGYVDQDTMEWLGSQTGFNELYFTLPPLPGAPQSSNQSKAETQKVLTRMTDKAENAGYTVTTSQVVSESPITSVTNTLLYVLTGISGLSLFLSVFLIFNTITSMVTQQIRQIGVMKAIGGRARQILWMYISVVVFYGLIALLIAVPLSILAGAQLGQFLAGSFGFTIHSSPIQPVNILIQVGIGILVPVLASLLPLINGLRISATQALSSEGISQGNYGANLIDRLLSGSNLWFARYTVMRPVILSLRNLLRHKGRLILTLITLAVAGAMFITIFNLRATILHSMTEMTQMQSFDLQVNFSQPYRSEEVRLAIAQIPEVQAVDNWLVIAAKRILPDGSEDDLSMTALKVDSSVISAPKILAGRWLSPGDGNSIVISSSILKNEPDLQVGQDILLKINNRHYTYTIVGEAMVSAGNTVFVSYPYTASLVNNYNWFSAFQIKMIPNADISVADLKIRLEQSLQASGFRIASIQTTTEMRDNIQSTFSSILILLMLMALLLAMVGGFGLMGTMSINVLERTREIGVLRAIGASNRGVTNVFMMEGVGIGLISCLFAIPLSFPITDLVARSIGMLAADAPWSGTFTASGVLIWIVTVIVLSLLANYLPARNAARLTVREVLAYE